MDINLHYDTPAILRSSQMSRKNENMAVEIPEFSER